MLKKSFYLTFACCLPLTAFAETELTSVQSKAQNEQVFPSKTYFLMALDNEINNTISTNDIGTLIGVPSISKDDAETVYFGMRKAMLKYASRAWDSGVAAQYGKDVAAMIGLHDVDTDDSSNATSLKNKLLLFRYAQQYPASKQIIQQYHAELDPDLDDIELATNISYKDCLKAEPHSDFDFYQKLSSTVPKGNQALSLVLRYEVLMPCQKLQLSSLIDERASELDKSSFQQALAQVNN